MTESKETTPEEGEIKPSPGPSSRPSSRTSGSLMDKLPASSNQGARYGPLFGNAMADSMATPGASKSKNAALPSKPTAGPAPRQRIAVALRASIEKNFGPGAKGSMSVKGAATTAEGGSINGHGKGKEKESAEADGQATRKDEASAGAPAPATPSLASRISAQKVETGVDRDKASDITSTQLPLRPSQPSPSPSTLTETPDPSVLSSSSLPPKPSAGPIKPRPTSPSPSGSTSSRSTLTIAPRAGPVKPSYGSLPDKAKLLEGKTPPPRSVPPPREHLSQSFEDEQYQGSSSGDWRSHNISESRRHPRDQHYGERDRARDGERDGDRSRDDRRYDYGTSRSHDHGQYRGEDRSPPRYDRQRSYDRGQSQAHRYNDDDYYERRRDDDRYGGRPDKRSHRDDYTSERHSKRRRSQSPPRESSYNKIRSYADSHHQIQQPPSPGRDGSGTPPGTPPPPKLPQPVSVHPERSPQRSGRDGRSAYSGRSQRKSRGRSRSRSRSRSPSPRRDRWKSNEGGHSNEMQSHDYRDGQAQSSDSGPQNVKESDTNDLPHPSLPARPAPVISQELPPMRTAVAISLPHPPSSGQKSQPRSILNIDQINHAPSPPVLPSDPPPPPPPAPAPATIPPRPLPSYGAKAALPSHMVAEAPGAPMHPSVSTAVSRNNSGTSSPSMARNLSADEQLQGEPPRLRVRRTTVNTHEPKYQRNIFKEVAEEATAVNRDIGAATHARHYVGSSDVREYEQAEKLGEGTFGLVFKATRKGKIGEVLPRMKVKPGDLVALKQIILHNEADGMPITSLREIRLLKSLDHPCVVPVVDMAYEKGRRENNYQLGKTFMVFPYMDHDLAGLLENPKVKLKEPEIKQYSKQLLMGTCYLHQNGILHRDMKAANLLINNEGRLMIADFGLARSMHKADKDCEYTNNVVTRWYRPPELLLGLKRYHMSVDMWGVGCVMVEMFKKTPLFPGSSDIDQADKIFSVCGAPSDESMPCGATLSGCDGKLPMHFNADHKRAIRTIRKYCISLAGKAFGDLIDRILVLEPKLRLTAAQALEHEWFWIDPLPADPKDMPRYNASHEYDRRKRDEDGLPPQARVQALPGPVAEYIVDGPPPQSHSSYQHRQQLPPGPQAPRWDGPPGAHHPRAGHMNAPHPTQQMDPVQGMHAMQNMMDHFSHAVQHGQQPFQQPQPASQGPNRPPPGGKVNLNMMSESMHPNAQQNYGHSRGGYQGGGGSRSYPNAYQNRGGPQRGGFGGGGGAKMTVNDLMMSGSGRPPPSVPAQGRAPGGGRPPPDASAEDHLPY